MSGQSMVRLGKTQGTDLERLHRGLQIAQNSSHLDGSFTNSKPKCLPLNLPNFKKNKPYQRLHFPSQINQLWARKNGKTRKIGCPWPLCGCSRIYHGSEATLHVRSPLKNQEPSDPLQLITQLQFVPKQRYSQRGQL